MKAARHYAERLGWAVVPLHSQAAGVCSCAKGSDCPSAGKHPRIAEWQTHATADAGQVAEWAARWPEGNVGIATGAASGFFVLDVDGDKGRASLAALEAKHGPLTPTVEARTGSGGTHYLYRTPGFSVANSASKLGPGLDIRGDHGQIVVAPSKSAKGSYSWVHSPFEYELADADSWLLASLQKPEPAEEAPPKSSLTFPRASPAVLDQARTALELHGPAVEGQGGDEHTFRAAAILTHDYALTEEEAWPIFVEWNESCSPAWPHDELAAKLRNGARYGTRARGCGRTADTLAIGRQLINAFMTSASAESSPDGLVEQIRELSKIWTKGDFLILAKEFRTSIGHDLKKYGILAPLDLSGMPKGAILVSTELAEMADKATEVLTPHVFARNGVLCEVVKAERTFLADLEQARVIDLLSRHAKWSRADDNGTVSTSPPLQVAQILCARREHEDVRVIEAITTAPVFLADGSILQERGYNARARVFLEPSVGVSVLDDPTLEDARAAVELFADLLSDFKFAEPADFSAWLAGLLACVSKSAIGYAPVPLVAVSASSPGAGKSLLTNVASVIVTGSPAEVRPYNPRDPGEWGKRITAFVREGAPISVFDNVNGAFGDETIDRLVTSATWADRVLGASAAPPVTITTVWWATGNNLEPIGDTVRRVMPVRIVVDTERPQERSNFKIKNILNHVTQRRSAYLGAALTILRAWHVAGRPSVELPSWGSFEAWTAVVRQALVWVGLADPYLTQRRAQLECNEGDSEAHDFWLSVVDQSDGTVPAIVTLANQQEGAAVLGLRSQITAHSLRGLIQRFVDRPRLGQRLKRDRDARTTRYYVERISA